MRSYRTVLCCLCLAGAGCVGTEIGNPPTVPEATVSVDFVAVEETPPMTIPIGLTVSDEIEVDRAVLLVGDLRFRQLATCDEAGADQTDGFLAELLEPAAVDLEAITLPSGTYCRLDVRPRRGGEDGFLPDHPELDGLTAYATGTFGGTPFELRYDSDDELSFRGEFELAPGEQAIFVVVDIPAWFDGLDLAAVPLQDGRIVVGDDVPELAEQFEDNVRRSISVALDADGDAMLTPADQEDEDSEP